MTNTVSLKQDNSAVGSKPERTSKAPTVDKPASQPEKAPVEGAPKQV